MLLGNADSKQPVALKKWLDDNGFTRANFRLMEPHLRNEVDYIVENGRYFVYEDNIIETILEKESQWPIILSS